MTTVGPEEFYACPACEAVGRGSPLRSYSNFSLEYRTDGLAVEVPEIGLPGLTRCEACGEVFVPAKAKRVGRVWRAPKLRHPGEAEFLEAIEGGLFEDRHECLALRLSAWRMSNGAPSAEDPAGPPRSPAALANMARLFELLDEADADHLVLKAEVARHLGHFKICRSLLANLPRGLHVEQRGEIESLALTEHRGLGRVRANSLWSRDIYLACPTCAVNSRTRAPGLGFGRWPSHWVVECRACGHVAWAVDCKVEDPTPERSSWPWVLLLWVLVWGVALGLGLRGTPLKLLGLSVIPLLIGNAVLRAWLRDQDWPQAPLPGAEKLLDCVQREDWNTPLEECWVRTQAWRRSCEAAALDPAAWSERAQRNQERLGPLLSGVGEGLLLSAELARRDGRFDEAIALLAEHSGAAWDPRVKRAREMAQGRDDVSPPI